MKARNEFDAAIESIQKRSQLKNEINIEQSIPAYSLQDCIEKFIDFKKNPTRNRKPISKDTLEDYKTHVAHLRVALLSKGVNTIILRPNDLTPKMVEIIFDYLKAKFPSSVTHKKYFGTYKTLVNFMINEEGIDIKNHFNGWHFEKKEGANEIIYEKEFSDLLDVLHKAPTHTPEGVGKGKGKRVYNRKYYYDWTGLAFKLALFTGARRQEVPLIRWSDIHPSKTGELSGGFILLQDIKVTSIQKLGRVKIKPIEINEDLADLLIESGYQVMKGKDQFIISPVHSRLFIKGYLSKSFAYYIKFVTQRNLSFECLRKTWFTSCAIAVGDQAASLMGGHSDKSVTLEHYINAIESAGSRGKFKRIFGKVLSGSALHENENDKN